MKILILLMLTFSLVVRTSQAAAAEPTSAFRIGIVGLVHDHAKVSSLIFFTAPTWSWSASPNRIPG